MSATRPSASGHRRLDDLLAEVGRDGHAPGAEAEPSLAPDAFFTARVLDSLPGPVRWTGVSPRARIMTLAGFHAAAALVGVMAYRWASPRLLDTASSRAAEAASPWASSLASVLPGPETAAEGIAFAVAVIGVVGLVAFWASRPHTHAT